MDMQDVTRRCHGNQNEDVIDVRPVFGRSIKLTLRKENGFYVPMRKVAGEWQKCEYLDGRGLCKANPEKPGYCQNNKSV